MEAQQTQDIESTLVLTFVHRLRHWTNAKATLIQCPVYAGRTRLYIYDAM